MAEVIPRNQASNAYQRLAFEQFDAPPVQERPASPPEPVTPAVDAPLEIAPGVSLPTLEDIERIQQEAQRDGYAAGYEEGIARGRMEAAELHQMVQALDEAMSTLDQQVADEIQALAIEIARQVVRETLSVRPEIILAVCREALQSLPQQGAIIHANPTDVQLLRRYMEEHYEGIGHRVVEDDSILPGGCSIESAGGQIDAQVQTRWRRVVENLTLTASEFLDE
ncbi:flagellar assembly protein FliH [Uliginosibacterium sp. 31-16]|uniref:flagellar assembly protein FliH n=1 Tax=Uliginosibacterium sp. 31-16 TaxID=3068315 RepID=UPI00273EDF92|nr:flagellar assembly protein FliH [Uliginosibacterium sp. 31-16]MDP5240785.1 flagellar assembly protein FliH [Uliginosibacterium sp. 31-16]